VPHMPGSLDRGARRRSRPTTSSCSAGDVFTRDLLETWIEYKREREVDPVRLRPVPYEFFLYYDA
jgi:glutamine synthetase